MKPISRMTQKELRNLGYKDLMSMTQAQIRSVVRKLADTSNSRLKKLEQRGLYSSAYNSKVANFTQPKKHRFNPETPKNRNELIREYNKLTYFLNLKSSTVTGARKEQAFIKKNLPMLSKGFSEKDFWEVYNKAKSVNAQFFTDRRGAYSSSQQQATIRKFFESDDTGDIEKVLERTLKYYDEMYKSSIDTSDSDNPFL